MKQGRIRKAMKENWKRSLENTNPNNVELVKVLKEMIKD